MGRQRCRGCISLSEKALEIHGYTDDFLSSKKKFKEICDNFLEFIKGKRLIIHNAEFDLAHINNELSLIGEKQITNEIVDTLSIARDKYPGSPASLDALCKRYRIDNSKRVNHSALIDCELLSKVYINLIDQKEPTLDFQVNEKQNYEGENIKLYHKGVVRPTQIEIENHKNYLKNSFKKNFF